MFYLIRDIYQISQYWHLVIILLHIINTYTLTFQLIFVDLEGKIVYEKSKYCPDGDAHVQLLATCLEKQEELLKICNKNLPMEKLSRGQRKEIFKKQKGKCNHCQEKFQPGDRIVVWLTN